MSGTKIKIMKSTIVITPTSNIKDYRVIDETKIETRKYDSDMDVFTFYNQLRQDTRRSNLMSVSLYEDVIVEGEVHYKILRMLSKNETESEGCSAKSYCY